MLDGIDAQLRHAVARREVPLPVGLGPASRFDPRLPGFTMPQPSALVLPPVTTPLPASDEDIAFAPIAALSAWIKSGGPMCRSVPDTALVLRAINGADPADPFSIHAPFGGDLTKPITSFTLGYVPEDFADPTAHDLDRAALEVARGLGARLVPLTRPDLPYGALMNMVFAGAAASFEELTLSGRDDLLTWQTAAAWPNGFRKARFLSAVDHIQLDRLRRLVMQVMGETMQGVDAIIGPSLTGPMTVITNFTGHPCLCLPSGFRLATPRGRLETAETPRTEVSEVPHSFSIWGRLFDEGPVPAIGQALEAAFALTHRRPTLGDSRDRS